MIKTAAAALMGFSLAAIALSGAHAQANAQPNAMKPSSGAMMMSGKSAMSADDMKTVKMCKGMDHDAMMKNDKCAAMMKAHPDAMKTNSSMMKK